MPEARRPALPVLLGTLAVLYFLQGLPAGLLVYSPGGHMSVHLSQPGTQPPAAEQLPPGVSPDLALSYACYSSY